MPDLGKYQDAVLSAYGISLLLLFGLVGFMVWRAKSIKKQLDQVEKRGA